MSISRIKELVNLELRIQLSNKETSDYVKEFNNFEMEISRRQKLIISDYNQFNQFSLFVIEQQKKKKRKSFLKTLLSKLKLWDSTYTV